ncbi:hypothetical protein HNY73_012241 [Argiope bruennichi]|uniref:Uncharacterized protein n=1 Tax=Argiope bruennichi TaxID=94029 RepID=A0A8T0EYS0_ARGBR|nr:hypothetical protein HNY73_012241 [Argiope bruennichi]
MPSSVAVNIFRFLSVKCILSSCNKRLTNKNLCLFMALLEKKAGRMELTSDLNVQRRYNSKYKTEVPIEIP